MDKINWKKKLSSRKLWLAIAGFVSMLLTAFGVADSQAAQIAALVMAGGTVVAYIIAEGFADASHVEMVGEPIELITEVDTEDTVYADEGNE